MNSRQRPTPHQIRLTSTRPRPTTRSDIKHRGSSRTPERVTGTHRADTVGSSTTTRCTCACSNTIRDGRSRTENPRPRSGQTSRSPEYGRQHRRSSLLRPTGAGGQSTRPRHRDAMAAQGETPGHRGGTGGHRSDAAAAGCDTAAAKSEPSGQVEDATSYRTATLPTVNPRRRERSQHWQVPLRCSSGTCRSGRSAPLTAPRLSTAKDQTGGGASADDAADGPGSMTESRFRSRMARCRLCECRSNRCSPRPVRPGRSRRLGHGAEVRWLAGNRRG